MIIRESNLGYYNIPNDVKDGICVDIGSNVGSFFSTYHNFFSKIHFYEPFRDCYQICLEKSKKYNKLIKIDKKIRHEKLKRKDNKYDLLIPIKYNFNKPTTGKGSCIFIHLTKNYQPTAGCVALKKRIF